MSKNFMSNGNATSIFTEFANAIKNRVISSMIASKESSTTASKAYSVGSYLILNDVLYKVITAIAQGETIVTSGVNANVKSTCITDELSPLQQSVTLSTSDVTTVTFTNPLIKASSLIEYACSKWSLVPDDIVATNGTCTITLPKVSTAETVTVYIFVR